ncbi:acetyl-CoA carboxylase biotin carboxyl carrier protein subunit [Saccharicrinis sp. FJH54]|uniref:acetyl-CoA carboxylase biotin carboxyl carrier protein subunit n=1 Tax=Saccharicrinis sp. FJH54 TaxID=3344665 RepID=UPI0035D3F4BF
MDDKQNSELKSLRIGDTIYQTRTTRKFNNRKVWEYPDPTKIVSYIPGTVIALEVQEGQKLKAGDTILVFEAMKMHTKITMPYDGEIVKLHVGLGDKYPKEHILADIK